jgi:hypothetical protein
MLLLSGRKYDLAVRPQSQYSGNPMLTSDANLLFASRPARALRLKHQHQHQHQELPIAELPFPSPAKFPHLPELPLNAEHTQGQATFFKHQLCECTPQGTAQSQ